MRPATHCRLLLAALGFAGLASPAWSSGEEQVIGEVVQIVDADILQINWSGERHGVRLFGLDAPESGQPYYSRAKEMVTSLAAGRNVQLTLHGQDDEGLWLARVRLPDGRELNQVLVRNGLAWWREGADAPDLEQLEKRAREEARGLWGQATPRPPWEYRLSQKGPRSDLIEHEGTSEAEPVPDGDYWEALRRLREKEAAAAAKRVDAVRVWHVAFRDGIAPVETAVSEVNRAMHDYVGLGKACRDLNLALNGFKAKRELAITPDPRLSAALAKVLGSWAHMARACQDGKERDMRQHSESANLAMSEFRGVLAPYEVGAP